MAVRLSTNAPRPPLWPSRCSCIRPLSLTTLTYVYIKNGNQRFFPFEIIINVLVTSFRLIWLPICYGSTAILYYKLLILSVRGSYSDVYDSETKNGLSGYEGYHSDDEYPANTNICITFVQRRSNVFDVRPRLYKCYTNVLCLLRIEIHPWLPDQAWAELSRILLAP